MGSTEPDNFDDPPLKAAVRRAWAGERAPQSLRDRIAAAAAWQSAGDQTDAHQIAEAAPAASERLSIVERAAAMRLGDDPLRPAVGQPVAPLRRRAPWFSLAAAAVLMLALGGGVVYVVYTGAVGGATSPQMPPALASALVKRHDACLSLPNHQLLEGVTTTGDPAAVGDVLRQRLGRPVLAASPGADWTFRGAGVCNVGAMPTAHLLYGSGNRSLSIFSLPADSFPELTGDAEFEAAGHPIVTFTRGKGLYCLVGSSTGDPLPMSDLRALRDRLRGAVALRLLRPTTPGLAGIDRSLHFNP